jgi:hypothetical protein
MIKPLSAFVAHQEFWGLGRQRTRALYIEAVERRSQMPWEWAVPVSSAVTAVAGIGATFMTARYTSKNTFRIMGTDRRDKIHEAAISDRRQTYSEVLHAYEEFYHTLFLLQRSGYKTTSGQDAILTTTTLGLLKRNLEVDLKIQNIERNLELIAPLDVVEACRHAFRALRDETFNVSENGTLNPEPYSACLSRVVLLMRCDVNTENDPGHLAPDETAEQALKAIYLLDARESAFRLRAEL